MVDVTNSKILPHEDAKKIVRKIECELFEILQKIKDTDFSYFNEAETIAFRNLTIDSIDFSDAILEHICFWNVFCNEHLFFQFDFLTNIDKVKFCQRRLVAVKGRVESYRKRKKMKGSDNLEHFMPKFRSEKEMCKKTFETYLENKNHLISSLTKFNVPIDIKILKSRLLNLSFKKFVGLENSILLRQNMFHLKHFENLLKKSIKHIEIINNDVFLESKINGECFCCLESLKSTSIVVLIVCEEKCCSIWCHECSKKSFDINSDVKQCFCNNWVKKVMIFKKDSDNSTLLNVKLSLIF
jgi:ASC-1-like (ASCH) protein